MTLQEIKTEKENKVSELIRASLMFFAFSNEQFQENKTPLQDGEKYIHIGMGAYMPKGKLESYLKGMDAINVWFKAAIKDNKQRRNNIAYELNNHEAFYIMDIQTTVEALGEDYTKEEVRRVFHEELRTYEHT